MKENWWDEQFPYRRPVTLVDPLRIGRSNEPVRLDLVFDGFRPHPESIRLVDHEGIEVPCQTVQGAKAADGRLDYATVYFLANIPRGEPGFVGYHLYLSSESRGPAGIDPAEDPATWHWDNYWRLFCVIERVLERPVLEREVENIWRQANRVVWGDREHNRMKYTRDFVDVSREPQQTIFPLDARKTFEFSPITGYSFVRYVNRTVPRMQIVQRQDSGWVNWGPIWEPMVAHVRELISEAVRLRIGQPTSRLASMLAMFTAEKSLWPEAEALARQVLEIDEQMLGPEHPKVAIRLNNLGQVLQATNRLAEAEPLMRRALGIDEKSYGPEHPRVAIRLNNLARLLQAKLELSAYTHPSRFLAERQI